MSLRTAVLGAGIAAGSALLAGCGAANPAAPQAPALMPVVYVANYLSSDISAYRLDDLTGALAPVPGSPFKSDQSPIAIAVSPSGRVVLVAHGQSRDVRSFTRDAEGVLTPAPGAPLRAKGALDSVAFHPSGRFAFAVGDGVLAFAVDPLTGELGPIVGTAFSPDAPAVPSCTRDPQTLAVSHDGGYLYALAGACISTLRIDSATGSLEPLAGSPFVLERRANPYVLASAAGRLYYANSTEQDAHGGALAPGRLAACAVGSTDGLPLPSCFDAPAGDRTHALVVHPSGAFVYATSTVRGSTAGALDAYGFDRASGELTLTVSLPAGPNPFGLAVDPDGRFVFVANAHDGLRSYAIDSASGAPAPLPGPVRTGLNPMAVAVSRSR
jgi:DNA-binding beta-propeller fold protein YncE